DVELFARAFASYIRDKLKPSNSDYLVGYSEMKGTYVNNGEIVEASTSPQGEERQRINAAMDALIGELKEQGILHQNEYSQDNLIENNQVLEITNEETKPTKIVKLTGKPVSAEMQDILSRLSENQYVTLEEINATTEIQTARSNIDYSRPTIQLENREELRVYIAEKLSKFGSVMIDENGKVIYNGDVEKNSRLDIVIGLPASGKSSAIVNSLSSEFHSKVVDNDEAKKEIPQFNNGWGAGVVHKESQLISELVFRQAIFNHENIVLPKVGSDSEKLLKTSIELAKNEGYTVYLHYVHLDRNKALGRMLNRFIEDGRFLDPALIDKYDNERQGNRIEQCYEILKASKDLIDGYSKWDNDVIRGERPVLLESHNLTGEFITNARRVLVTEQNKTMEGELDYGRDEERDNERDTEGSTIDGGDNRGRRGVLIQGSNGNIQRGSKKDDDRGIDESNASVLPVETILKEGTSVDKLDIIISHYENFLELFKAHTRNDFKDWQQKRGKQLRETLLNLKEELNANPDSVASLLPNFYEETNPDSIESHGLWNSAWSYIEEHSLAGTHSKEINEIINKPETKALALSIMQDIIDYSDGRLFYCSYIRNGVVINEDIMIHYLHQYGNYVQSIQDSTTTVYKENPETAQYSYQALLDNQKDRNTLRFYIKTGETRTQYLTNDRVTSYLAALDEYLKLGDMEKSIEFSINGRDFVQLAHFSTENSTNLDGETIIKSLRKPDVERLGVLHDYIQRLPVTENMVRDIDDYFTYLLAYTSTQMRQEQKPDTWKIRLTAPNNANTYIELSVERNYKEPKPGEDSRDQTLVTMHSFVNGIENDTGRIGFPTEKFLSNEPKYDIMEGEIFRGESEKYILRQMCKRLAFEMNENEEPVLYMTDNLGEALEAFHAKVLQETKSEVAIESTIDYEDSEIGFVSVATDNMPAGTKYRLVTLEEKGNIVPYQEPDIMYLSREELQDYIEAHKDDLEVVNYNDMVYQAGNLKFEYITQQLEMIESGLHSFEFEDGYLHFSLDVNGYSYDGLYRIYDPVNGKSREIVSFNDYDPVIKENWDFIERRLTQYVNEHPEVGLNGEQIPRERPSIYCEWSEHGAFREGTVYSPSEFSQIMEESDNEWIKLREMELQQYGKDAFDILMDQGLPQHQTYTKVKYEIYIPGMEPLKVRQDIGDGFGSVTNFLERNGYKAYADKLMEVKASEITAKVNETILQDENIIMEKSFAEQVDEVIAGTANQYNALKVCDTPQLLLDVGCEQLPMLFTHKHLHNAIRPISTKNSKGHGLTIQQVKKLPELLANPVMIYDSQSQKNSIVVVTEELDARLFPVIVSIKTNGKGTYELQKVDSNFITSVYGR
ncbi:MAG: LPD25 domain-containing protein, partial [Lachnospiraceae bacterium]